MVKDTEKAGTDGQATSQRGGRAKLYRREEQEVKSRKRISNLDSAEMLLQSGGSAHWCSLAWRHRRRDKQEQGKRKKIPDSSPKANLKSKPPLQAKTHSLAVRHCSSQVLPAGINGSTPPREDLYGSPSLALPGSPFPNSCAVAGGVLQVLP